MASKKTPKGAGYRSGAPNHRPTPTPVAPNRNRLYLAIAGGALALLAVIAIGFVALSGAGSSSAPSLATGETIYQAQGGHWTNVTPDRLAEMLTHKDFTLVNVKTAAGGQDGQDPGLLPERRRKRPGRPDTPEPWLHERLEPRRRHERLAIVGADSGPEEPSVDPGQ